MLFLISRLMQIIYMRNWEIKTWHRKLLFFFFFHNLQVWQEDCPLAFSCPLSILTSAWWDLETRQSFCIQFDSSSGPRPPNQVRIWGLHYSLISELILLYMTYTVITCILSNGQSEANKLVSKRRLIVCKLMRKWPYFFHGLLPQQTVSKLFMVSRISLKSFVMIILWILVPDRH